MFERFLDFLFPPRIDSLRMRSLHTDEFLGIMAPTLLAHTTPATTALMPFHDERVRSVIHEAKYHGTERAFRLLGEALTEYLLETDERMKQSVMVPVPLSEARRQARGYNQVEEICEQAVARTAIPLMTDLLVRTRETVSQVSLPGNVRRENMRGAFAVPEEKRLSPTLLYILVDDVITTGATLQAASDALTKGGARHILPVALAY